FGDGAAVRDADLERRAFGALAEVFGGLAELRPERVAVERREDLLGDLPGVGGEALVLLADEGHEGPDGAGHDGDGEGAQDAAEKRVASADREEPVAPEVDGVQRVERTAAEKDEREQTDGGAIVPGEELVDVAGRGPEAPLRPEREEASEECVR